MTILRNPNTRIADYFLAAFASVTRIAKCRSTS